jgi:hypothetical protein
MACAEKILPKAVKILEPKKKILDGLRVEFGDRERYIALIQV